MTTTRSIGLVPAVVLLGSLAVAGAAHASEAASVHGEATLESPVTTVVAGELLVLNGSSFVPGQKHRLILRGALDEYVLGAVTAGADSTFAVEMRVPAEVGGGQFRVVAVAPDDDEVATLDLALTPAPASTEPREAGGGQPASEESDPAGTPGAARTDEVVVQRDRSGVEWSVIGLVIGLAGGLGVGLIRRG